MGVLLYYVVLRLRPDVLAAWSDEEVTRRWWRLFPRRRDKDGHPAEPQPEELAMLTAEPAAAKERRRRLGSLSWLMRCLCEPMARRANREDQCTGRFWEGRFKCQALLDEAAVLACNVYVDLNPIRAKVAQTPEESRFTSAYDRIEARRAQAKAAKVAAGKAKKPSAKLTASAARDGWLSPIEAERPSERVGGSKKRRAAKAVSARRASSRSFLAISLEHYLALLDWTGRQLRSDKRGSIPGELAPILKRLGIADEHWLDSVAQFGRWFHRAAGRAEHLLSQAARCGRRWFQGIAPARLAFS
jgi:hypothetical protein